MSKHREWYEKYIGYCFNDNGVEVILEDILTYEDGSKCYQVRRADNGRRSICPYSVFKDIAKQTRLPKL